MPLKDQCVWELVIGSCNVGAVRVQGAMVCHGHARWGRAGIVQCCECWGKVWWLGIVWRLVEVLASLGGGGGICISVKGEVSCLGVRHVMRFHV